MRTYHVKIDGMSCQHCVMSVKKELSKVDGLQVNDVRLGYSEVVVDESKVSEDLVRNAVKEAGYSVLSIN